MTTIDREDLVTATGGQQVGPTVPGGPMPRYPSPLGPIVKQWDRSAGPGEAAAQRNGGRGGGGTTPTALPLLL